VKIPSFAKVNLGLEVLGRRPDGYHDIRTLFQWVDFHDTIDLLPRREPEIKLSGDDPSIPWDERNLVFRAAALLREKTGCRDGAVIAVAKRIPAGGGLGGGSSNAAATLFGLNLVWDLGLSREELEDSGRRLGMDVPYFLTGGLCLGEDRGDRLTSLPDLPPSWLVLVLPPYPVSTALIYGSLDQASLTSGDKVSRITRFLGTRNVGSLVNALEETVFRSFPQLLEIKGLLREQGAVLSLVTGSGAGVFGLFEDRGRAEAAREALAGRFATVLTATMSRAQGWDAITAGASPSGKAAGFGPAIRGFESSRPSSGYKRRKRET
jgi:4-diphosphocytidyl-2-C-methyl-D-erythritol kinase